MHAHLLHLIGITSLITRGSIGQPRECRYEIAAAITYDSSGGDTSYDMNAAWPRSANSLRHRDSTRSASWCSRHTYASPCSPLTACHTTSSLNSRLCTRPRICSSPFLRPGWCRSLGRFAFHRRSLIGCSLWSIIRLLDLSFNAMRCLRSNQNVSK